MKKKNILVLLTVILLCVLVVSPVFAASASNVGEGFCDEKETMQALKSIGTIIVVLKLAVPIIIITVGLYKFIPPIIQGTVKSMTRAAKNIGFRILIGLAVFMLPSAVDMILSMTSYYSSGNGCYRCLFNTDACNYSQNTSEM